MSPGIPPGCLIEANRIPQFRICSTWVWGKCAQRASIPAFSRKNRAWAAASPAGGKQPVLQFVNRSAELAGSGSTAPLVLSRSRLPDGLCDVPSCFPIQRPPFTARDRQGSGTFFGLPSCFVASRYRPKNEPDPECLTARWRTGSQIRTKNVGGSFRRPRCIIEIDDWLQKTDGIVAIPEHRRADPAG